MRRSPATPPRLDSETHMRDSGSDDSISATTETSVSRFAAFLEPASSGAPERNRVAHLDTWRNTNQRRSSMYDRLKGGLLVVAQWRTAADQADKIADILGRFLPQAQAEPGVKLFLIGRGKDDRDRFLFY